MSVSDEIRFLSSKRILLSGGGTKRDDNYYTVDNSQVDLIETTTSHGQYKQSLSNLTFNSSSQVLIQNGSFLGNTYLYLKLPAIVANQGILMGWGYAIIRRISYLFGTSNAPEYSLDTQGIFQTLMYQCGTSEKMNQVMRMAGLSKGAATAKGSAPYDDSLFQQVQACCLIPCPWSNLAEKKYFDTSLLNSPITIRIELGGPEDIYSGTGARPPGFSEASISLTQGRLSNQGFSLRSALDNNTSESSPYGFIHHQNTIVAAFDGSSYGGGDSYVKGNRVTVNLTGFLNADLLGITMGVRRDVRYLNGGGTNGRNPFFYEDIEDVQVDFNGSKIYDAPGSMYRMYNMESMMGGSTIHLEWYDKNDDDVPKINADMQNVVFIDFTRVRSAVYDGTFNNVKRIGNATVLVSFVTPNAGKHQLFACYHYNSINLINQGISNIFQD
jgi:hypothetical protein